MSTTSNPLNTLNDLKKPGDMISKTNTPKRLNGFKKLNDDSKAFSYCQDLRFEDYKIMSKILKNTKIEKDLTNESSALIAKTLTAQKSYLNRLLENIEVYSQEKVKINNKVQKHLQIVNKFQLKIKKYEDLLRQGKEETEKIKNNIILLERKLECLKTIHSDQNTPTTEMLRCSPIKYNLKERRSESGLKDVNQQNVALKNAHQNKLRQKSLKKSVQKTPFSEIPLNTILNNKRLSCVNAAKNNRTSTINSSSFLQPENNFRCSNKQNKNKMLTHISQTPISKERARSLNSCELFYGNKFGFIGKNTENLDINNSSVIQIDQENKYLSSNNAVEKHLPNTLPDASVLAALDKSIFDKSFRANLVLRSSIRFVNLVIKTIMCRY